MTKNELTNALPFKEIPSYEGKAYVPGNIVSRMVDGLGYRYYWATEGLTERDLAYKPSEDGRSVMETLEHVCGLSEAIMNAAIGAVNVRPKDWKALTFPELRKTTLSHLKAASEQYAKLTEGEVADLKVTFESNGKRREFPFWNMINGPISDALYHAGQVVSFRRASGNPLNPNVSVFTGKTRE